MVAKGSILESKEVKASDLFMFCIVLKRIRFTLHINTLFPVVAY